MELKGREIVSLPVIEKSTGKDIGEVKRLIYSLTDKKIKALLIEDNGWLWGKNVVLLKDVESIGRDTVIISSQAAVTCTADDDEVKKICAEACDLMGYKIITSSGEDFGVVEDLVIEAETGNIIGLEISDGLLTDLLEGRRNIKYPDKLIIGEDALIFEDVVETIGGN